MSQSFHNFSQVLKKSGDFEIEAWPTMKKIQLYFMDLKQNLIGNKIWEGNKMNLYN